MTTSALHAAWVAAVGRHRPGRQHAGLAALLADHAGTGDPPTVVLDADTVYELCTRLRLRTEQLDGLLRSLARCGYLTRIGPAGGGHKVSYWLTTPSGHPATHGDPSQAPTGDPWLKVDTTRPHPARRYNYWLGGKDHFAADRESGDAIAAVFPHVRTAAIENRRFLRRAVSYLAEHRGIRQFLDIGTGLPAAPDVHEIAEQHHRDARVVYVDSDPLVMVHARALMIATPPAATAYIEADLRDPDRILTNPELAAVLDLREPVGLLLVAVLHFLSDTDDPGDIVAELMDALPAGSCLVLSHATYDPLPAATANQLRGLTGRDDRHGAFHPRSREQVAAIVTGFDPVPPGLVPVTDWRPHQHPHPQAPFSQAATYAIVAAKP
jgi:hypothetical protein